MLRKIFVILFVILFVSSCGLYNNKNNQETMEQKQEITIKNNLDKKEVIEYGDLTEFIKTDLTQEEKEELLALLEKRKQRQGEIKSMLNKAAKEGNLEEKLEEVKSIRKKCANLISKYVAEEKKEAFFKKCEQGNEKLREIFTKKAKSQVKTYTLEKVASYNTPEKCRTIVKGKVYDLTSYFGKHPGGDDNLQKLCGIDGTQLLIKKHGDNQKVWDKLETMYKGELAK